MSKGQRLMLQVLELYNVDWPLPHSPNLDRLLICCKHDEVKLRLKKILLMFVKSKAWASCLNLLPLPSMYCPSPSPNANANPSPNLSPSASVGAYFNFLFAWLGKQKIPTKEQTPQTGFVPQWVFSVSKAMQLWTVAVWLVECQAVSFRKIRDDESIGE